MILGQITLLSLEFRPGSKGRRRYWLCRCECGREWSTREDALLSGKTLSCGKGNCRRKAVSGALRTTHDLSRSIEYGVWAGMLYRCENPNAHNYQNYGGRGITVCDRWHDIDVFIEDVGLRPTPDFVLARNDLDCNYEPGSCEWVYHPRSPRFGKPRRAGNS